MRQLPAPGVSPAPVGRPLRAQTDAGAGADRAVGRDRTAITPTNAASSSAVGTPRTTRNNGSSTDMTSGYAGRRRPSSDSGVPAV